MKTETWYMLRQKGFGFIASVSTTRSGCIDDACSNLRFAGEKKPTWEQMKKRGYSVQKVRVVPVMRKGQK